MGHYDALRFETCNADELVIEFDPDKPVGWLDIFLQRATNENERSRPVITAHDAFKLGQFFLEVSATLLKRETPD